MYSDEETHDNLSSSVNVHASITSDTASTPLELVLDSCTYFPETDHVFAGSRGNALAAYHAQHQVGTILDSVAALEAFNCTVYLSARCYTCLQDMEK